MERERRGSQGWADLFAGLILVGIGLAFISGGEPVYRDIALTARDAALLGLASIACGVILAVKGLGFKGSDWQQWRPRRRRRKARSRSRRPLSRWGQN
jgi:hypothetical protein